MSEPEIDALMAGQEDENGSVHYEGEHTFSPRFLFCIIKSKFLCTKVKLTLEFLSFFCFVFFSKLAKYA